MAATCVSSGRASHSHADHVTCESASARSGSEALLLDRKRRSASAHKAHVSRRAVATRAWPVLAKGRRRVVSWRATEEVGISARAAAKKSA